MAFTGGDLMEALDPRIAAAIIRASGGLIQKVLELTLKPSPDKEAEKVLSKVYDKVAPAVTPNSLRVLRVLQEAGAYQTPKQIAGPAQRLASRQEPGGEPFEPDITYRLRYLCLLGLVHAGAADFALTKLGAAFIESARRDKLRYSKVFKDLDA
jgi:hypothetical protein